MRELHWLQIVLHTKVLDVTYKVLPYVVYGHSIWWIVFHYTFLQRSEDAKESVFNLWVPMIAETWLVGTWEGFSPLSLPGSEMPFPERPAWLHPLCFFMGLIKKFLFRWTFNIADSCYALVLLFYCVLCDCAFF